MPEFDPAKDQLVMDFRSGDELVIQEMSFDACIRGNCQNFDLLDFAAKNDTFLVSIYYFKVISTKLPRGLFGHVDLLRPIRNDYFHEYSGGPFFAETFFARSLLVLKSKKGHSLISDEKMTKIPGYIFLFVSFF